MIGVFNTITLNGEEIFRGNEFTLSREYIYAGEYETCTGKRVGDIVGWRYADLSLTWDNLPQSQLQKVIGLNGSAVAMTFSNEFNETVTEMVIPTVTTAQVTRLTDPQGNVAWSGIGLTLKFINAHN
jgi:hypothetical protein